MAHDASFFGMDFIEYANASDLNLNYTPSQSLFVSESEKMYVPRNEFTLALGMIDENADNQSMMNRALSQWFGNPLIESVEQAVQLASGRSRAYEFSDQPSYLVPLLPGILGQPQRADLYAKRDVGSLLDYSVFFLVEAAFSKETSELTDTGLTDYKLLLQNTIKSLEQSILIDS